MAWNDEIRRLFPRCEEQVYLDSAFSNGGCTVSQKAMERFFHEAFSGALDGKRQWNEATQQARELCARLLGDVDPKQIAFTKNTVEGLNIVAQAFPWQEGDNVVIMDQEHTSNLMPWLALQQRGVKCRMVHSIEYELPLESIIEVIDEHTRIVAISHVQSSTGYRCDLQKLAEYCRAKGVFLVVDAIQSLGVCPCDAKSWGIDAVAAGGHKSLLALPGVGILYVAEDLLKLLRPIYAGSSAVNSIDREQWINHCSDEASAQKLELSNLNYPGIYALRAGLELLLNTGIERIWAHVSILSQKMNRALREIGYEVVTPSSAEHCAGIVSVSVPNPVEMKAWFAEQGIIISKMDAGYVRFSLGVFSSEEDVDRAVKAAKKYYETVKNLIA